MLSLNQDFAFPVLHSVIDGESVCRAVTAHHALGGSLRCDLIKKGLNDTYLLTAGRDRFIARLYDARRPASEVHYELQLLNHLASRAIAVSAPVPGRDGQLAVPLSAPEGTRLLVVFEYAPGAALSWDEPDHCALAGRLLASVHAATDDFSSPHERTQLNADYLIHGPLSAVRPFLADRPADWGYLTDLASMLQARLSAVAGSLDWGVCHGDYGAKNIHLAEDGTATVLDFDYSGAGWRTYDFGPVRRASRDRKNEALWEAFLSGYTEVRPFARANLDVVMLFRVLRQLAMLGIFARNVGEWGTPQVTGRRLDAWFNYFRTWQRDAERA